VLLGMVVQLLLSLIQTTTASVCVWGTPTPTGVLDPAIAESSGMAVSRRFTNRSYRINDSGDRGRFFVTALDGKSTRSVDIENFMPVDTEDMALAQCGETDCLFIGDIGDNSRARSLIELVVLRERSTFPASVKPDYRVRLRYPDGPHDAESLGVHPDGSVYILTKDASRSQLFRLGADQWRRPKNPVETLSLVTTIEWARVLPNVSGLGRLPTAMDIAPDGDRFLVLTYTEAIEFFFDLSKPLPSPASWKEQQNYRRVTLTTLEQQEAIAYLPDAHGFLYDTERAISSRPARILRVACRD